MSEGQSYSNMEFMNSLPKSNGWDRLNANPTGLQVEQIELGTLGRAYMDDLIKRKEERFNSPYHRFNVMKSDPIARFICERYIEEVTAKPFKSYDMDMEGQPVEIMADLWERWEQLEMNQVAHEIYRYLAADGYCLCLMGLGASGGPSAKCFGYYHCQPDYWKRYRAPNTPYHNVIYDYFISYIPIPSGYQYMMNYNIHAEEFHIFPAEDPGNFFHFYRKDWNHGIGVSRLQGVWASITKLRKMAHADYRRALVFNILEFPEDWDGEKQVEPLIDAASRVDEVEGMAMPKRVNKMSGEVEDWPRLRERTWDEEGGKPRADPSAGGSLLRHSEYARVLIDLGYTETKLVGSQPGEVTGSKLDLTRDDEVDIREFNLFTPVIKKLVGWLLENGFLQGLEEETIQRIVADQYDIKCHIEWEVLENMMAAAEMAEEQAEMDAGKQEQQARNAVAPWLLRDERSNSICIGFRTNINYPMTPLMSSTVKGAGVYGSDFLVQFHESPGTYRYHFEDPAEAERAYFEISQSSPGGYIWDKFRGYPNYQMGPAYFSGKPTPGGTTASLVPYDIGGRAPVPRLPDYAEKAEAMKKYKVSEVGTTREPFKFKHKAKKEKRGPGSWAGAVPWATAAPAVPYSYYNAFDDLTFGRANTLMREYTGEGIGKETWYKFKDFFEKYEAAHKERYNSLDIGNPMAFDIPLRYAANNELGFTEEYVCKRDWKLIEPHEGKLWLYKDLKHGGKRYNVGKYKYEWDTKNDKPIIERDYNDEKIKALLIKWGKEESRIYKRLNEGKPLPMSTEYYCSTKEYKGKMYQTNFHDGHGNPRLKGIAIVERGNCDEPFCKFKIKEET